MNIAEVAATVLGIAHFIGVATIEHFFDSLIVLWRVEFWMGMIESIPGLDQVIVGASEDNVTALWAACWELSEY